jgi:DNA (cytosine-5)-methyltransferase 1
MGDTASGRNGPAQNDGGQSEVTGEGRVCGTGGPGNANELRPDGLANPQCYRQPEGRNGDHGRDDGPVFNPANFWSNYDIAICDDLDKEGRRKARRVESSTFPLAHGVSNRVGLLRGYGNAINPVLAAEFIKAAFGAIEDTRANP